jgi:hypothetical protein
MGSRTCVFLLFPVACSEYCIVDRVKWFQDHTLRGRAVEQAETLEEEFGHTVSLHCVLTLATAQMRNKEKRGDRNNSADGWRSITSNRTPSKWK